MPDSSPWRRIAQAATLAVACSASAASDNPKIAIQEECKKNAVSVSGKVESTSLYVDRPYLRILVKPHAETYGLTDVVRFILANGYSALETTSRGFADLLPSTGRYAAKPGPTLVRVGIKPLGDPACEAFENVKRYPALNWPWLRELGVRADECIGVEPISGPERSTARILVEEHVLEKRYTGDWAYTRLNVRVVDASRTPERVVASMTEHYERRGGGKAGINYYFPCKEGNRQAKTLSQAFASTGRGKPPELVEVDSATPPPVADQVSDADLSRFTWIVQPGKIWSTNVINPEGTAWVARRSTPGYDGYRFNVFLGDRIASARIPLVPEVGSPNVTGMATTPGGWAVVSALLVPVPGTKKYLVEFDAMGKLVRVGALSESQYAMLSGAK